MIVVWIVVWHDPGMTVPGRLNGKQRNLPIFDKEIKSARPLAVGLLKLREEPSQRIVSSLVTYKVRAMAKT